MLLLYLLVLLAAAHCDLRPVAPQQPETSQTVTAPFPLQQPAQLAAVQQQRHQRRRMVRRGTTLAAVDRHQQVQVLKSRPEKAAAEVSSHQAAAKQGPEAPLTPKQIQNNIEEALTQAANPGQTTFANTTTSPPGAQENKTSSTVAHLSSDAQMQDQGEAQDGEQAAPLVPSPAPLLASSPLPRSINATPVLPFNEPISADEVAEQEEEAVAEASTNLTITDSNLTATATTDLQSIAEAYVAGVRPMNASGTPGVLHWGKPGISEEGQQRQSRPQEVASVYKEGLEMLQRACKGNSKKLQQLPKGQHDVSKLLTSSDAPTWAPQFECPQVNIPSRPQFAYCVLANSPLMEEVKSNGQLDPVQSQMFSQLFESRTPGVVVDTSGDLAYFSLLAAKMGRKSIIFEGKAEERAAMQQSILKNGLQANVALYQSGLSDTFALQSANSTAPITVAPYDKLRLNSKIALLRLEAGGLEARMLIGAQKHLRLVQNIALGYNHNALLQHDCDGTLLIDALLANGFAMVDHLGVQQRMLNASDIVEWKSRARANTNSMYAFFSRK